jgi:hypothetical protein
MICRIMTAKLSMGKVAIGWAVLLMGAALALPPMDSHAPVHPVLTGVIVTCCVAMICATLIAVTTYFNRSWRRVGTVPNRAAYVTWLALESIAALSVLMMLMYPFIRLAVPRLR